MDKISGIYKITNIVNNKIYIGQSKDISCRWKDHLRRLRSGKHDNDHLQKAWGKYGENNFKFEIIEICEESYEVLNNREIYWINKLKALDKNKGYNIASGGGNSNTLAGKDKEEISAIYKKIVSARIELWKEKGNPRKGFKMSDEQKEKIRNSLTGEKNSNYGKNRPEHSKAMKGFKNPRAKTVRCITTGEIFKCAIDGANKYNTTNSNILKCCKGKQKSAGKLKDGTRLIWQYY